MAAAAAGVTRVWKSRSPTADRLSDMDGLLPALQTDVRRRKRQHRRPAKAKHTARPIAGRAVAVCHLVALVARGLVRHRLGRTEVRGRRGGIGDGWNRRVLGGRWWRCRQWSIRGTLRQRRFWAIAAQARDHAEESKHDQ